MSVAPRLDSDAAPAIPQRLLTVLSLAGMVGPALFTILVIAQGLLLPDYSHVALPISALTAWPTGWIQVLNFCVTGALVIGFFVGLHRAVRPTRHGLLGVGLLIGSGCGAGVFPWLMVEGVPTETPAHVVAAITAFAGTGLGLVVVSRRMNADPQWHDLAGYMLSTGIVVLILFVMLGFFAVDDGTPLHPWAGLIQRIVCAVWFTALVVLALRLRRLSTKGLVV